MELKALDHLVLTTQNLDACLHFYVDILGMRHIEQNGRHALAFGYQKINIHTQKGEFQPAAAVPTYGSLDLCILTQTPLPQVRDELLEKGAVTMDETERNAIYARIAQITLYEDPFGAYMNLRKNVYALSDKIEDFAVNSSNTMDLAHVRCRE